MENRKKYVADFETTSTENFNIEKKVRVWAWQLRNIKTLEVECQGTKIESFIDFIKNKNIDIFFHNLKFDGQFIISELFKQGYTFNEKTKNENEWSCLIDMSGQFFNLEILWKKYKKNKKSTRIFDSFKKIPLSVSSIAESYGIEEKKGIIDYEKYRSEDYEPSQEEWEYLNNDTLIVAKALKEHFEEKMTKMTIASDAYGYFKSLYSTKKFNYIFPEISKEIHNFCSKSYKGGFVWLNPKYKEKILENVISFDVNSLYPDRMRNCLLPYGKPKHFIGKYVENYFFPLYIQKFTCIFKIKDNMIPTIQIKKSIRWNESEYLLDSDNEQVELTLTSVDLKLFLEHYNVYNINYIEGYMFKGRLEIFNEYIDKFYEIKCKEDKGKKQIAKLFLNSLYGKFGSGILRTNMIPYYEEGQVKFSKGIENECRSKYIPMASFITAYAREKTISSAQKFMPNNFIYSDTDSIHLIGVDLKECSERIEVDKKILGGWKFEGLASKALFLRAKTYMKEKKGEIEVTCCGMPKEVKKEVTFDNFYMGNEFQGKLQQKKIIGGVLLSKTTFKLKSKKV